MYTEYELLYAGALITKQAWHMPAHQHTHHQIIVLIEGGMHLQIKGGDIHATAGDTLLYRAGEVHDERNDPSTPFRVYFVGISGPELPACIETRTPDIMGRIRQLLTWLYDERDTDSTDSHNSSACFLQSVIAELVRLTTNSQPPIVRQIRTFARQHLNLPLSVDDLSAHVGMSKYHFIRTFKQATGCTPMEELRAIRTRAAKDLILTTNLPFKQIAELCGLGTPQHFSRIFREQLGISPSQLRNRRPSTLTSQRLSTDRA